MIIVSQDKSKITQRLEFYIQQNHSTDEELQYEIRSIGGGIFGGYKTEERAKEVLQEIANTYTKIGIEFETFNGGKQQLLPIYEMPEE